MKKRARAGDCRLHPSLWWVWVSLVAILAGACKPRDLVCKTGAVFQALKPQERAGAAPFSIEQLGPEVKQRALEKVPIYITLTRDNRARSEWMSLGHIWGYNDLIYSPTEGLAQNVDRSDDVYPMRRVSDGAPERFRLGFRSKACRDPDGGSAACEFGDDKLFLVAEMTCHPK